MALTPYWGGAKLIENVVPKYGKSDTEVSKRLIESCTKTSKKGSQNYLVRVEGEGGEKVKKILLLAITFTHMFSVVHVFWDFAFLYVIRFHNHPKMRIYRICLHYTFCVFNTLLNLNSIYLRFYLNQSFYDLILINYYFIRMGWFRFLHIA